MHRLDGALDVSGGNNGANGGFQVAQRQRIHLPMQETQERDAGWIPGLGRSPGGKNGRPLQKPEKSHGQRSLAGYSLWGCKELDTTERLSMHMVSSCLPTDE